MERVLVHTCCAPCLTGVHYRLKEEGYEAVSLWYNPNIHPFTEWERRLGELLKYRGLTGIEVIVIDEYPLKKFLKGLIIADERGTEARCSYCIGMRLKRTAEEAKRRGFDYFTTTLLVSRHQPHELIRDLGRRIGKKEGIKFLYIDFRKNWKDSVRISRSLHMYRQGYCGCILSEAERYRGEWEEGKKTLKEKGADIWFG